MAQVSAELQGQLLDDTADVWEASPFAWIREQPSARTGAIGVTMVRAWAKAAGFEVFPSTNSDHDLQINGLKIEVKLSTLWANGEDVPGRRGTSRRCSRCDD